MVEQEMEEKGEESTDIRASKHSTKSKKIIIET